MDDYESVGGGEEMPGGMGWALEHAFSLNLGALPEPFTVRDQVEELRASLRPRITSPVQGLVLAIFCEAWNDLAAGKRKDAIDAWDWIFGPEQDHPFAFEVACHLIGGAPSAVREACRRTYGGRIQKLKACQSNREAARVARETRSVGFRSARRKAA